MKKIEFWILMSILIAIFLITVIGGTIVIYNAFKEIKAETIEEIR